jgi:putative NIF3 family GTP cyclohydrolase 1 type 2
MQTAQQVIDAINARIPGTPFPDTVDTVKAGDPATPVTGIVTTFLATRAVLERAVELGANLVIAHEPTFYSHLDQIEWLDGDPVYQSKQDFLDEHGLVVWRFHDGWHAHRPDGIVTGVLEALGWTAGEHPLVHLEGMRVADIAEHVRERLGAHAVRIVGDPEQRVDTLGLVVGMPGGLTQIEGLRHCDALLLGEVHEWETTEYVRDAIAAGIPKAIIVAGHEPTEEAGMGYLARWLADVVPGIPVTHVPSGDPFEPLNAFSGTPSSPR